MIRWNPRGRKGKMTRCPALDAEHQGHILDAKRQEQAPYTRRKGQVLDTKCRGQAYTEFVVVLPGVLLLLLLAWEFAYFWWGRMVVSTATFEAARQVATGESPATGYQVYNDILGTGMGQMAGDHEGYFWLSNRPESRSVYARAAVPYQWPTGLGALMGGRLRLSLQSSAFFRLEEFYPGPPQVNWYNPAMQWE
jgi:hypothetical protein